MIKYWKQINRLLSVDFFIFLKLYWCNSDNRLESGDVNMRLSIVLGLIISLVIMVSVVDASHKVKIDSNKILNIDGERIFPVGIYATCSEYPEQNGLAGPCTPSKNNEFLYSAELEYNLKEITRYKTLYENAGMYFTLFAPELEEEGNIPQDLISSPHFFGYMQMDEPSNRDLATVSNTYNNIKAQDKNHPVILNVDKNMMKWYPYTDILTWDAYPFLNDYTIGDAMYVYEIESNNGFFKNNDINSIGKPVWAVLQANGVPYTLSGMGSSFLVPTPAQIRSNTYCAITMDVKGIAYWGYEIWADDINVPIGSDQNEGLHDYVTKLAGEIRSFNDWITTPTIDYSWGYHIGNDVIFDKVLTKFIDTKQFTTNFNYILKSYNDSYYLIVVNKDSRPVTNVTMSITIPDSNLSTGNMTATTLGMETQGSGRAGRNIPVNNGTFADSFDGNVVHIYQIG